MVDLSLLDRFLYSFNVSGYLPNFISSCTDKDLADLITYTLNHEDELTIKGDTGTFFIAYADLFVIFVEYGRLPYEAVVPILNKYSELLKGTKHVQLTDPYTHRAITNHRKRFIQEIIKRKMDVPCWVKAEYFMEGAR